MGREIRALPSTRVLFLLVLAVLAAAYTAMAFSMDWRVASGQIGPGFFPRFVGGATVVGCLVAIARGDVSPPTPPAQPSAADRDADTPPGPPGSREPRTDPRVVLAAVAAMVVYYLVFEVLGAALASALFLAVMLTVVNPGRHRANAAVSLAVPAGLYLLFEVLLDAGLPPGLVLPL